MTGCLGVLESTSLSSRRWTPWTSLAAGALVTRAAEAIMSEDEEDWITDA